MAEIVAEMAGIIAEVLVKVGDHIQAGQDVVVMESMKMQIPVKAERAGTVKEVRVQPGDFVNQGDTIVVCE